MINCIACHTPSMTTGANSIAALSFQPVPTLARRTSVGSEWMWHDPDTIKE
jgi:hypothetical protein